MGIKLHSSLLLIALSATSASLVHAAEVSDAREALTKQSTDADSEQALEEVFEAAESNYSLMKKGGLGLNYSFDYSYYADQRLSLLIAPQLDASGDPTGSSNILSADVSPSSSHTFTNSFSLDYGLLDNVTIGGRLPLIAKFDTERSITNFAMGDFRLRTLSYRHQFSGATDLSTDHRPPHLLDNDLPAHRNNAASTLYYGVNVAISVHRCIC